MKYGKIHNCIDVYKEGVSNINDEGQMTTRISESSGPLFLSVRLPKRLVASKQNDYMHTLIFIILVFENINRSFDKNNFITLYFVCFLFNKILKLSNNNFLTANILTFNG